MLIERARKVVKTDPREALSLTEAHRRRWPRGVLSPEREVIAIEALALLGRTQEAERRAQNFSATDPASIHAPRIRAVMGDGGIEVPK